MKTWLIGALLLVSPLLTGCSGEAKAVYRSGGVEQEVPSTYAEDLRRIDRLERNQERSVQR